MVATVAAGLLFCLPRPAAAQTFVRIHGATILKALLDPHIAEITAQSGVNFELVGNGTEAGLADLDDGQAEIAMLSIPLADAVAKLNATKEHAAVVASAKFTPVDSSITAVPLGSSPTVLVVNRNNPVRKLTDQQAIGVLNGTILNWKEVGGLDRNIVVVVTPPGFGNRGVVESQLLKKEKFRVDAVEVPSMQQVRASVADQPRAIGPISASKITDKVAAVTLDSTMANELSFAVKGEPSAAVKKLAEAVKPYIK